MYYLPALCVLLKSIIKYVIVVHKFAADDKVILSIFLVYNAFQSYLEHAIDSVRQCLMGEVSIK